MRIVIDKEFTLDGLNQTDLEFLKSCSIFYDFTDQFCKIIPQKIDLCESYMEQFLDMVDYGGHGLIELHRYANGRYSLVLSEDK